MFTSSSRKASGQIEKVDFRSFSVLLPILLVITIPLAVERATLFRKHTGAALLLDSIVFVTTLCIGALLVYMWRRRK